MLWLKGCPKCHGDLHLDSDVYGAYIACVQCGYQPAAMEEQVLRHTHRLSVVTRQPAAARRAAVGGMR